MIPQLFLKIRSTIRSDNGTEFIDKSFIAALIKMHLYSHYVRLLLQKVKNRRMILVLKIIQNHIFAIFKTHIIDTTQEYKMIN